MLKKIAYLLILIPFFALAQQQSVIKHIKSNNGNIQVSQTGHDSAQKSIIDSIQGKGIKIKVVQNGNDTAHVAPKPQGPQEWIANSNNLVGLIVGLITLIVFIWKGIPVIKNLTRKK